MKAQVVSNVAYVISTCSDIAISLSVLCMHSIIYFISIYHFFVPDFIPLCLVDEVKNFLMCKTIIRLFGNTSSLIRPGLFLVENHKDLKLFNYINVMIFTLVKLSSGKFSLAIWRQQQRIWFLNWSQCMILLLLPFALILWTEWGFMWKRKIHWHVCLQNI